MNIPHINGLDDGRKSLGRPACSIPDLSAEASLFCTEHGMEMDELLGFDRRPALAHLRQKFYYTLVQTSPYSLAALAKALGRDHTTILHGSRAHAARNGLTLRTSLPKGRTFWRSNWRPAWWIEEKVQ